MGLGSSYGAPAKAYEMAFEQGCNYFYWGTLRKDGMGEAIRNLAPKNRNKLVVVIQSYSRFGWLLKRSFHSSLKKLKLDYADVLLLGWYNKPPSQRIFDTVLELKQAGLIKATAISCHHRPTFQNYIEDKRVDIIMTRYNAAHRGCEREVFPFLDGKNSKDSKDYKSRPGVVAYTATRWGKLNNPKYTPPGEKTPTASDCYRFVLSNPHVDVCLSGPSSLEQMTANLEALKKGPMNEDELDWMRRVGDYIHNM